MELRIANVTVNTDRPRELAEWWAAALGGEITADYGEYVMVGGQATGMAFQLVRGTKPGRIHVDLAAEDAKGAVERLVEAGAKHVAYHEVPDASIFWTVLTDPDGNEFCVAQGH